MLKKLTSLFCILLMAYGMYAQGNAESPEQLKKRMTDIRKSTNWDNAEEAKRANDSIKILSKKLSKIYQQMNAPADETEEQKSIREENQEYKDKLFDQITESAAKGENADILLGQVSEENIDKFIAEEEEKKKKKSPEYFKQMNFLCIDMSSPEVQTIIDQMDKFKEINVMLLTGGQYMLPADFSLIFSKASKYPLKELYITRFGNHLKQVPKEVSNFKELTSLMLFNNSISQLPSLHSLQQLKTLHVDMNPLNTIINSISALKQLEKLGTQKTGISDSERTMIKKQLPNCHIDEL